MPKRKKKTEATDESQETVAPHVPLPGANGVQAVPQETVDVVASPPSTPGEGRLVTQEARILATAIKRRWPMNRHRRALVVQRLIGILEDSDCPNAVISAAKALITAEGQNQKDQLDKASKQPKEQSGQTINVFAQQATIGVDERRADFLDRLREEMQRRGISATNGHATRNGHNGNGKH